MAMKATAEIEHALSISQQLVSLLGQDSQSRGDGEVQRKALQLSKQLVSTLEKPKDVAFESILWSTYAVCSRIAIQLGLYESLVRSKAPRTVEQLAESAHAEPLLVGRVLRVISSVGLVQEVDQDVYVASPVTNVMASTAMAAAGTHFWDQSANCMAKFPEFLEQRGYSCPIDPKDGLFQYAFKTKNEAFEQWSSDAKVFDNFNLHLGSFHRMNESWLTWYPVKSRLLGGLDLSSVVIVDIGGGKGQNLQEFSEKFPQEKGRLVLQDTSSVISDIQSLDDTIQRQAHNFFTPQPIEGARIYFFSRIFHDWSDQRCSEILQNLKPAMSKGYSKLLIHDFVLSDTNCARLQAGFDIHMMCMHAGMERTRNQWKNLLHENGFQAVQFWMPPDDGEGIIEAQVADD